MRLFKKSIAGFFILLIIIALIEVSLRIYYCDSLIIPPEYSQPLQFWQADPLLGWVHIPDKKMIALEGDEGIHVVSTNSKGLRDLEHRYADPEDRYRILVLGDSFVEGFNVGLESSFHRLIQQRLREKEVEIINMGVDSYGTVQEFLYLKKEGLKYQPDLVLLTFLCNDIRNNSLILEVAKHGIRHIPPRHVRPYFNMSEKNGNFILTKPNYELLKFTIKKGKENLEKDLKRKKGFLQGLILWNMIGTPWNDSNRYKKLTIFSPYVIGKVHANKEEEARLRKIERIKQGAEEISFRLILEVKRLAEKNNAEFVLILIPEKIQVDESYHKRSIEKSSFLRYDFFKVHRDLIQFCNQKGIKILDLTPVFAESYKQGKGPFFETEGGHWNKKGHRLAASSLCEYLEENGVIE